MTIKELFVDKSKTLIVNTDLALVLGDLNEAIVLNQLNYWLTINEKAKKNFIDGKYWVYNSYAEWRMNDFPYWSEKTIQRTFSRLENKGVVISANYNKMCIDKTKWYSIDFDVLKTLKNAYEANKTAEEDKMSCREGQNDRPIPEINNKENYFINRLGSVDNDFDNEILKKAKETTDNVMIITGIGYYLKKFKHQTGNPHPNITYKSLYMAIDSIETLLGNLDSIEDFESEQGLIRMIDNHFDTEYSESIDYKLQHFASSKVLEYQARTCRYITGWRD